MIKYTKELKEEVHKVLIIYYTGISQHQNLMKNGALISSI